MYYSATLRFVILVDEPRPRRTVTCNDSVVVFRAKSFEEAFKLALAAGRKYEETYKNFRNQDVRWAFVDVQTLDRVGRRVDGAEVASTLRPLKMKKALRCSHKFHPERSSPTQTF